MNQSKITFKTVKVIIDKDRDAGSIESQFMKKQTSLALLHYTRSAEKYLNLIGRKSNFYKFMSDKIRVVADIGGVSGVFDYNGGALPILIGYRVIDEDYGDNISMPILDIEILPGKYDPLYGTLNDLFTGEFKCIYDFIESYSHHPRNVTISSLSHIMLLYKGKGDRLCVFIYIFRLSIIISGFFDDVFTGLLIHRASFFFSLLAGFLKYLLA